MDIQVLLGVLKSTFQSNNIDKVKLMVVKKDWMLTTKDIYLRSDFESKDDIKDLGGMYDIEKKRWFTQEINDN